MIHRLALAVLLALTACSLPGAAPDFRLQKIGDGVWAAIVNDEGLAGGNAGFVIGDDGVLVIDTFQDPRPAKALLGEISSELAQLANWQAPTIHQVISGFAAVKGISLGKIAQPICSK